MKVLVIGGGGREHTLVWKLSQSPSVTQILWSPGNPAATSDPKVQFHSIPVENIQGLADLAQQEKIDLTVVGPEIPLVLGISDEFQKRGLTIFGPTKRAAQLEGSKVFSKEFFLKYKIPTGKAEIFTDFEVALKYAKSQPKPLVVKADGLAAGKGVIICRDDQEIAQALSEIMQKKVFGESGQRVLIEECLSGPEVSVHAITDGSSYQLLASAQDHKRALDHDLGPNTGGMGTYSPAPIFDTQLEKQVRVEIFDRTIAGLKAEGIPFCGVLFAGLMITEDGPKILEYNCRFGDPETQVILPRLQNDLAEVLLATCRQQSNKIQLTWKNESAVCVVLAAGGYPGSYKKGDVIQGLDAASQSQGVQVFHAGTTLKDKQVVTSGGRVLGVTALGSGIKQAIERAYGAADKIQFKEKHYRRDIAARALLPAKQPCSI
jgi:phosphoribosylamine---glycine ligase